MKRPFLVATAVLVPALAVGWWVFQHAPKRTTEALLARYCVECHDPAEQAGNLTIDPNGLAALPEDTEHWEKIVRKLRARAMPPEGPRPDEGSYATATEFLETALDRVALERPQPGSVPAFRRLTRTEYRNAIRDLLALENLPSELDFELLLPADNASSGFDNIADLLFVSPVVMERYIAAAQKIARLAVGDLRAPVMVNIHQLSEQMPQDERVDELSFGTRGGMAVKTYLPLDAEYVVETEAVSVTADLHEIELSVDGVRVAVETIGATTPGQRPVDRATFSVPIAAGSHLIGITFVERSEALDEGITRGRMRGRGTLPAIAMATIRGPFAATGSGDTPSRERIFTCRPSNEDATQEAVADAGRDARGRATQGAVADAGRDARGRATQGAVAETTCAREIMTSLARRAYRNVPSDNDIADLMAFYEQGRAEGNFDAGVQLALERLLVSPQFLYRVESEPQVAPGEAYAVNDVELASRISFFLWSSIPDDELLDAALAGRLRDPGTLRTQVQRMLADPRSESLVTNFAAQWLFLRDVEAKEPDIFLFPDHDVSLKAALERETELFVDSVLRGGRSVVELVTANHTFVNERLAKHYGIPNVQGSYYRRVDLPPDGPRAGLLGQGSILTVTSYATRTSPVLRGKYVLENLLAAAPPPPPADVPALATEDAEDGAPLTMRDAMIRHRANPVCASCHAKMDPIGFALENFDAVGRWRDDDAGKPIDVTSELPDGSLVSGPEGVRSLLLEKPELFVTAVTEKLMMYALGRNVQYYDAPAIRAIVRDAAAANYEFSSLVEGIVASVPFQMRTARATTENAPTVARNVEGVER